MKVLVGQTGYIEDVEIGTGGEFVDSYGRKGVAVPVEVSDGVRVKNGMLVFWQRYVSGGRTIIALLNAEHGGEGCGWEPNDLPEKARKQFQENLVRDGTAFWTWHPPDEAEPWHQKAMTYTFRRLTESEVFERLKHDQPWLSLFDEVSAPSLDGLMHTAAPAIIEQSYDGIVCEFVKTM